MVGLVYMVAIARCFGVVHALNQQKTKVFSRTKALISHAVFERIGTDAKCVSLLRRTSAGTLVNLFPAAVPATPRVSKMMNCSIPVYNADGSLYSCVSEQRLTRLQSAGLVSRVVRHRKGCINRAILFMRPGEPKPLSARSVMGTTYSFKESLEHGRAWELKHLDGTRGGRTYAPPEMQPDFLRVFADCLVPCCHESIGTTGPKTPARCTIAQLR